MEIQGAGHTSASVGQDVTTTGIVTQVGPIGYYVQDPNGDGNDATSDARLRLHRHRARPSPSAMRSQVSGKVAEFSADPGVGLTITEIDAPTTTMLSHGNALPDAVLIGVDGRLPPSQVIDDDGLTSFDPAHDGIDFYESLEGMRVTVENPLVIQSTNAFGETYVVASGRRGRDRRRGARRPHPLGRRLQPRADPDRQPERQPGPLHRGRPYRAASPASSATATTNMRC